MPKTTAKRISANKTGLALATATTDTVPTSSRKVRSNAAIATATVAGRAASPPEPRAKTSTRTKALSSSIAPSSRAPSKQATIIALLSRPAGATIGDLVAATGWQQHTVRAALTRLRQQGYHVSRASGADGSVYRIIGLTKSAEA